MIMVNQESFLNVLSIDKSIEEQRRIIDIAFRELKAIIKRGYELAKGPQLLKPEKIRPS